MVRAVAPGKLLLRNSYRLLRQRVSWDSHLTLDDPTRSDLQWWFDALGTDGWNGALDTVYMASQKGTNRDG